MTDSTTKPEFPRITAAYASTVPGSTKGMLLVRDEHGHTTRHIDYAHMESWFSQHHPSVFTEDGGNRVFNLGLATPTMLSEYFACPESVPEDQRKLRTQARELGCLVDPLAHGYGYTRPDWGPSVAAGVGEIEGATLITSDLSLPHGVRCRPVK